MQMNTPRYSFQSYIRTFWPVCKTSSKWATYFNSQGITVSVYLTTEVQEHLNTNREIIKNAYEHQLVEYYEYDDKLFFYFPTNLEIMAGGRMFSPPLNPLDCPDLCTNCYTIRTREAQEKEWIGLCSACLYLRSMYRNQKRKEFPALVERRWQFYFHRGELCA